MGQMILGQSCELVNIKDKNRMVSLVILTVKYRRYRYYDERPGRGASGESKDLSRRTSLVYKWIVT